MHAWNHLKSFANQINPGNGEEKSEWLVGSKTNVIIIIITSAHRVEYVTQYLQQKSFKEYKCHALILYYCTLNILFFASLAMHV